MSAILLRIAEKVLNTPLLIESAVLDRMLNAVAPRLGIEAGAPIPFEEKAEKREMYAVGDDGIAVIDIQGALANRFGAVDAPSTQLLSYEEIAGALETASEDGSVRGIILRMDSPGGSAEGLPSLVKAIESVSASKPVWASVDDSAYSAAYWIASAANRIYVTETAGVGSIGVIARHVDQSKMNDVRGLKVTAVYAGARKNDYTPHEPLSGEAHERLQKRVNDLYGMFVDAVAHNRSMAKSAVRKTEADTYHGSEAIDIGLADKLGAFRDVRSDMAAMLKRGKREDMRVDAPIVITEKRTERHAVETRQMPMAEVRAESGDEPLIAGHIAVFGQWSLDLGGFVERIMPGAFVKTLKEADIHHYFNHDGNIVLGRVKSGTLRLSEDDTGLYLENNPPNTQTVRDLVLEPMRRGDIDQGSFAFLPVRQEWGRIDGKLTRTLHEVRLFHTSVLPRGAYPQTDVSLRAENGQINFSALAMIDAKRKHQIPLTEEESAYMQDAIRHMEALVPVTPGVAAHLTTSEAPPLNITALRNRLEVVRRRIVA